MTTTHIGMRLAASCGILYPVLLIVGDDVIARGDEVASDAGTAQEVLAAIAGKDPTIFFVGRSIGLVSMVCLFIFAAYVAVRLRAARGEGSLLAALALGGGAIAATLQLGSAAFSLAMIEHGGAGLSPELAVLVMDFGSGFLLAMLPLSLLLLAVAVAGVQGQLVGRVVGWIAAVLAAGQVVGFLVFMAGVPIGFIALPLSWLWFVAAGISCLRRELRHAPTTAAPVLATR